MAVWSEVRLSELPADFRLDPSYYDPDILLMRCAIENSDQTVVTLESISSSIVNFGAYSLCNDIEFQDQGVSFITAENIMDGFIDYSSARCIPLHQHENLLWKSRVYRNQVLVAMAARLGYAAVYDGTFPLNSSKDVAKITLKDVSATDPYYVAAFINSRLGRKQLLASQTGSVQQHTNLGKIKALTIVTASQELRQQVSVMYKKALGSLRKSQHLYVEAEDLLLSDLGLPDLDMSPDLFYESQFSESFEAGRIDAEFYRPRFQRLLQAIDQTQPKKVAPLGEFCQIITNGHTPKHHDFSTGEVPFLMAEQILDFRIHYDTDKFILREQHDGELKRTKLREGDLLVTIKGRIGNAGIVEDLPGAVNVNQDIARIRLREGVPPYYILAFMNSLVGKGLVQKYCTGQINPFLSLANLRLIPIPIYEDERMKAIAAEVEKTVRSARSAQEESRRLLELAKVMIEQSVLRDKTT